MNVNQAITNSGLTSPLTINAGTDINVNAAVGRTAAGSPSSTVTLNAGQNVHLNHSIVTENAALSVTAQNGTVTSAPAEGLFAGSANITGAGRPDALDGDHLHDRRRDAALDRRCGERGHRD